MYIWLFVILFYCNFKNIYPGISLKLSFYGLPLSSLPHKITYIQTALRQIRSQVRLFLLQIFLPNASADCWLRQSHCTWRATIRRYGLQRTEYEQIIPNDHGDQNFRGLLPVRYSCRRFKQYDSSSYHKNNTFIGEEVRIVCSCK
jgi:hypothetical protein